MLKRKIYARAPVDYIARSAFDSDGKKLLFSLPLDACTHSAPLLGLEKAKSVAVLCRTRGRLPQDKAQKDAEPFGN